MFNPRVKLEMSTITCNREMKGKCQNSCFEPPFGDLGVTRRVYLWLDGKHVADFLLAIIAILASSLGCGTIKGICRNRRFLTGVGHYERKF